MVDAGRILIMPKGIWSNLASYEMLDLVTQDGIAYLARQASVGQSPKNDSSYTYWQPFGSATLPDNETIISNSDNEFAVNIDNRTLKYDSTNNYIKVPVDGTTIKYDITNGYLYVDKSGFNISDLGDVTVASPSDGQVMTYDNATGKWKNTTPATATAAQVTYSNTSSGLVSTNVQDAIDEVVAEKAETTDVNNKHKVTSVSVTTSGWTTDTTSQSGTTLYKKQVSLNHVYANPSVDIGAASGYTLPTTAEQEAYDLLLYVTVDTAIPCLYLYASDIPTDGFYINVEGCD